MALILNTDTRFGTQNWAQRRLFKRDSTKKFYWFYADLAGDLNYRIVDDLDDLASASDEATLISGINFTNPGTGAWDLRYNPSTDTIAIAYQTESGGNFTDVIRTGSFAGDGTITLQAAHSPRGAGTSDLGDLFIWHTTNDRWIFAFCEDKSGTTRWIYLADDATPTLAGDWTLILTDTPINNTGAFGLQQRVCPIPGSSNSEFTIFYRSGNGTGISTLRHRRYNGVTLGSEVDSGVEQDALSSPLVAQDGDVYMVMSADNSPKIQLFKYDVSANTLASDGTIENTGFYNDAHIQQFPNGDFLAVVLDFVPFKFIARRGSGSTWTDVTSLLPADLIAGSSLDFNNTPSEVYKDPDTDEIWFNYLDFKGATDFDLYVSQYDPPTEPASLSTPANNSGIWIPWDFGQCSIAQWLVTQAVEAVRLFDSGGGDWKVAARSPSYPQSDVTDNIFTPDFPIRYILINGPSGNVSVVGVNLPFPDLIDDQDEIEKFRINLRLQHGKLHKIRIANIYTDAETTADEIILLG